MVHAIKCPSALGKIRYEKGRFIVAGMSVYGLVLDEVGVEVTVQYFAWLLMGL